MASGKSDELKGRVKEAAGALTGDKKLKREGKTDQAVGKIKQQVVRTPANLRFQRLRQMVCPVTVQPAFNFELRRVA